MTPHYTHVMETERHPNHNTNFCQHCGLSEFDIKIQLQCLVDPAVTNEKKILPDLSPAEIERLAYLIKECSEVINCATKILRHGYENHHPNQIDLTNRRELITEIADVYFAVKLMLNKDLNQDILQELLVPRDMKYFRHQSTE